MDYKLIFILIVIVLLLSCTDSVETKIEITAPSDLNIVQVNVTTCHLTWTDNSSNEEGFRIDRKANNNEWELIYKEVNENITFFEDDSLDGVSTYFYRLYAYADDVVSSTIEDSIYMSFPAPTNLQISQPTITSCHLSWEDNSNGEDGFRIDRKIDDDSWVVGYAEVEADITTFEEGNLNINSSYIYRVYGFAGENISAYIEISVTIILPEPENLTLSIENISGSTADLKLVWDYNADGIDGFKIRKNSVLLTEIVPEETTQWIDVEIDLYDVYSYQVLAVCQNYYSGYSNEVIWEIPAGMIFVQGGSFDMGDYFNEGEPNELPVHTVLLDNFFIGEHEITHSEYIQFLNDFGVSSNGSYNGKELIDMDDIDCAIGYNGSFYFCGSDYALDIDCPVIHVTWFGAIIYSNWMSQQDNLTPCYTLVGATAECDFDANGYRLPTEAEWEYTARGGIFWTDNYRYVGCQYSGYIPDYAWFYDNADSQTHPVGTKLPNQLGVYDMNGNVWEWCNDWFDSSYYSSSPTNNPTGSVSGLSRVLRGGSWFSWPFSLRVSHRFYFFPLTSSSNYGFRIVRKVE